MSSPYFKIALGAMRVSLLCLPLAMAACTPQIDHHGYLAKPGVFDQVQKGMSKSEVEAVLGSPSTTASVHFQGDSYYYISSVTEQRAFLNPKEVDRQVIAVRFDQNDHVASFGQYGLEDGRIIDLNTRETPSAGREFSILRQIFGNLGKPGLPSKPGAGL